jgi:Holliday junction resolvase
MSPEEIRQVVQLLRGLGFSVVSVSGSGDPGFPFRVLVEVPNNDQAS